MRDKGYDFIRFCSMLLIIILHFCSEWMKEATIPYYIAKIVLRDDFCFAFVGVALFFILSGALLWKNYKEEINTVQFYRKRILKIWIPQWIAFVVTFGIMYIVQPDYIRSGVQAGIPSLIVSFLGLNFDGTLWNPIGIFPLYLVGEWFTCVIIVIYILFPIFRWLFKNHRIWGTVIVLMIFLINLKYKIFTGDSGRYSFTNAFMYFWMGMIFEEYKKFFTDKRVVVLLVAIDVVMFVHNPSTIFGSDILVTAIFSCMLFVILYQIKVKTRVTSFICKYNYEIYLVHHRIYYIFIPLMIFETSNWLQISLCFIVLMVVICRCAELLRICSGKLEQLCTSKIQG